MTTWEQESVPSLELAKEPRQPIPSTQTKYRSMLTVPASLTHSMFAENHSPSNRHVRELRISFSKGERSNGRLRK